MLLVGWGGGHSRGVGKHEAWKQQWQWQWRRRLQTDNERQRSPLRSQATSWLAESDCENVWQAGRFADDQDQATASRCRYPGRIRRAKTPRSTLHTTKSDSRRHMESTFTIRPSSRKHHQRQITSHSPEILLAGLHNRQRITSKRHRHRRKSRPEPSQQYPNRSSRSFNKAFDRQPICQENDTERYH